MKKGLTLSKVCCAVLVLLFSLTALNVNARGISPEKPLDCMPIPECWFEK